MTKKIILFFISGIIFLGLLMLSLFFIKNNQNVQALTNVILPATIEPLMDFDCSNLPCVILGPKKNNKGAELKRAEYQISINNMKFNNLPTVSFVLNKGDVFVLNPASQDQLNYHIFIPKLNLGHTFSSTNTLSFFINTAELMEGDYLILLQDSLDSNALTNFQAGVLRIE